MKPLTDNEWKLAWAATLTELILLAIQIDALHLPKVVNPSLVRLWTAMTVALRRRCVEVHYLRIDLIKNRPICECDSHLSLVKVS